MSARNRRPFIGSTSSDENARILADPNVSYRLLYWDVASVAASARDMLAYGKVKWANQLPVGNEWQEQKIPTPFGVMPVLNVISPDGKEVFLAESVVIDHYLAKRFGLLGDNEWEEFTIKGLYNNIHYLRERSFMNVTWTYEDKRKVALERFMNVTLPEFIANHQFHLKANGSNGHYVGNKHSLADIHLVNIMDHFSHLPTGATILAEFEKSEELMKVKKVVEQNPEIAAWRATEECKALAQGSIACYAQTAVPKE
ncbi:Glutathione S-transferase S1 [Entomortierella chlamydospora]|uniref:glutathione transferase n=1 Tax=Entomortierella chlamydospora TaxID=101097 RepID=A0A9P6SZF0_9FUNG|nr:Glutathione S-transferase S1 [Entomortierella chlamydospora]KAG0013159.1 Glutathione S-transferase S1 [Entomortierella chlamydospora]